MHLEIPDGNSTMRHLEIPVGTLYHKDFRKFQLEIENLMSSIGKIMMILQVNIWNFRENIGLCKTHPEIPVGISTKSRPEIPAGIFLANVFYRGGTD